LDFKPILEAYDRAFWEIELALEDLGRLWCIYTGGCRMYLGVP